jgi:uncharacterized delta-60 repeat protein
MQCPEEECSGDSSRYYRKGEGHEQRCGFESRRSATGRGAPHFLSSPNRSSRSLDPPFGTGGIVTTPTITVGRSPCGLAIQKDDKIPVAGGGTSSKGFPEVAVARFNTNGSLDSTFGTGGLVTTTEDDASGGAFAMALQPNGKILVVTNGDLDLLVIRYNPNGFWMPPLAPAASLP